MADIVNAVSFLLENQSVNGIELYVDGGWHTRGRGGDDGPDRAES